MKSFFLAENYMKFKKQNNEEKKLVGKIIASQVAQVGPSRPSKSHTASSFYILLSPLKLFHQPPLALSATFFPNSLSVSSRFDRFSLILFPLFL